MDNLGWSNQQLVLREADAELNADYSLISGSVDLTEALLLNSCIEFHGLKSFGIEKLARLSDLMELIAPSMNLVNTTPKCDFSHGQEENWSVSEIEAISRPYIFNPPGNLGQNLYSSNQVPAFSSIGEEGASKFISNCKNMQNLSCSGNVSSGNSNASNDNNKEGEYFCSIPDEAASQSSSNPDILFPESSRKRKESSKYKGDNDQYRDILQSDSSTTEGGFQIIFEDQSPSKKPRPEKHQMFSFRKESCSYEPDTEVIAKVKEMIYRAAAMRPVSLGMEEEAVEKPKRKNVRISSDPQTVAARHRRERISERLRVLQKLVPGGSKMDTATMLDEAANYIEFLKSQVSTLETLNPSLEFSMNNTSSSLLFSPPFTQPFPMNTPFHQAH